VIRIRGLRKAFGARAVLRGIDADVEPGRIVAIVGPSGCGKSTLLRCLNGLTPFEEGAVTIAGATLSPGDPKPRELQSLRAKVGMVFQEFHLFAHLSALDNVTLAPRLVLGRRHDETTKRAHSLLAEVGMDDRSDAYPHQLSGGQKQRVAIARALALPLDVLLLDEPTSALDRGMREEVRKALREVASRTKLTMLVVTHDMRLARALAHEAWIMKDGQIAERGDARPLLAAASDDDDDDE
jgi:ABC-type polar amino acid transport system ATPase subunit